MYEESREYVDAKPSWEVSKEEAEKVFDPCPNHYVISHKNAQRKRILVCAPSNGAVDEIASRILKVSIIAFFVCLLFFLTFTAAVCEL